MNKQDNGNTQLNSDRENFNNRVSTKKFLGNTYRAKVTANRRHRSI